ncbi:ketosteroid isomerase-like protein [Sphingobium xenophagum]|uniref:Ketosteroid isomerase-like protein n=1 Tax=Sphingobium xenophagum TaxID=121428 RepID=A0ABU1X533_SPHXE|nr:nuclear transport factor 2 family protein [Sphingobium xenophagum]MDR7156696.1 ketosteroid isomerase-like protein [Sphingobium xenophagum]
MSNQERLKQLADDMMRATEVCDLARLDEIWSPDLELWYNTTQQTLRKEQMFGVINGLSEAIEGLKFTNVRRIYGDDGYVEQRDTSGRMNGVGFCFRTCIVVEVLDGRVIRVDEWWDSAQDPRNKGS